MSALTVAELEKFTRQILEPPPKGTKRCMWASFGGETRKIYWTQGDPYSWTTEIDGKKMPIKMIDLFFGLMS